MEATEGSDAPPLSDLQIAVLRHYAEGKTPIQVARSLAVSEATMRRNLHEAREALGAATTAHAIYLATRAGLI